MHKVFLLVFLILLQGCTLNNLFISGELDKVTVVKYTSYMKHHRAFFRINQLKVIKNGKKYLYLYNKKNNNLAVLLHRQNQYVLYNLSRPNQKAFSVRAHTRKNYTYILKSFKRMGYKTISSLSDKGFIVSVSYKKYKGVKTLLFEVKEYTRLMRIYKTAIRTYNAHKIKNIKTILPKSLIKNYYTQYKKRAKTDAQLTQLRIIAKKLLIKEPTLAKIKTATSEEAINEKTEKIIEEERAWYDFSDTKKKDTYVKVPTVKPYHYYLHNAPLKELTTYISEEKTKSTLSHSQYRILKQREYALQEEKLLKEGSLEELIAAYKVNKKSKYKERIMSLMKDKQKHKKLTL